MEEIRGGANIGLPHFMPIHRGTNVENNKRQNETTCWDAIAKTPTQVFLNIQKTKGGNKCTKEATKHPPIEKGDFEPFFIRIKIIKLVSTKS
ncbi:hypothetical protein HanPSC8_Chr14g0640541 [Helianthus annuus]|nr:hypothetical protein HanPSC8_Chr14g0640541 [Helianthus annuus]